MTTRTITLVAMLAMFCGLLFIQSCGSKGNDPLPVDQTKSVLTSGIWKLLSVSVDGVDKTSLYTGLTLSFTVSNFNSTNGRVIWPNSGTWQFTDGTGKNITRGDGLQIAIDEASTSKLVLKLTWNQTTLGPGRVNSLMGVNVFSFGK